MIPLDVPTWQQLKKGTPFEAQFWLNPLRASPAQNSELSGGVVLDSYRGRYLGVLRCDLPTELRGIPGYGMPVQVKGLALTKENGRIFWVDEIRPLEARRIVCGANLLSLDEVSSGNRDRLARLVSFHQQLFPLTLRELLTRILIDPSVRVAVSEGSPVIDAALTSVDEVFLEPRDNLNGRMVNTAGLLLAVQEALPMSSTSCRVETELPSDLHGLVGAELGSHLSWLMDRDTATYRHLRFMVMALKIRSRQMLRKSMAVARNSYTANWYGQ